MRLETNIRYLPLAYQCAIEWVDTKIIRDDGALASACDHFEKAYGLTGSPDSQFYRDSAAAICARRFWNWNDKP